MDQKTLKQYLRYEPDTGHFYWRVNRTAGIKSGDVAGHTMRDGYRIIRIMDERHMAHRLAWLYCYGEIPTLDVDHIDCDRQNNRISNLRLATASENRANSKKVRAASGYRGVYWHPHSRKWQARMKVNGRRILLGYFDDPKEAAIAYDAAAKIHFGEFARPINRR